MPTTFDPRRAASERRGSALLIVLAFVVLLTALILAFFSRSILEEQVSTSSANQVKVDNFAQGAVADTISDLKQEIQAGSATPFFPISGNNYIYYYTPTTSSGAFTTMLPAVTGSSSGVPPGATFGANKLGSGALVNLIKVSLHTQKFYGSTSPPFISTITNPTRAAAISTGSAGDSTAAVATGSGDGTSVNGRYISGTRWNKPLFLAPGTVFPMPDWIYVERNPTSALFQNATLWNANLKSSSTDMTTATVVLGRYAYAIYDEGGLLDVNVAGAPTPLAPTGSLSNLGAYKNGEALADLTQIPGLTQTLADTIVGWRNNASAAQWQGTTSNNPLTGSAASGYTWSNTNATNYFYNVLYNPVGFLRPASTGTSTGTLTQTDQFFTSRQQLLQFFNNVLGGGNTVNGALQYLTTFSRSLEQPSTQPAYNRPAVLAIAAGGNDKGGGTEDNIGTTVAYTGSFTKTTVNPSFLSARATTSFTRNDGTIANVGDPLVKKRFALNRLAWLTYLGPIADDNGRLINNPQCSLYVGGNQTAATAIINALENTYGLSSAFLAQGGPTNIQKYFGLVWVQDNSYSIGLKDGTYKWKYEHGTSVSGSGVSGASTTAGSICPLGYVAAAGRDPDFFELLKASISVGALGKIASYAASPNAQAPSGYQQLKDESVDAHVIQLGANIIDAYDTDSYPTRILFDDGTWKVSGTAVPQEYRGMEDLPYLYAMRATNLKLTDSTPAETSATETLTGGVPSSTITQVGSGVYLLTPEIWDPFTWNPNATASTLRPTQFQIVALSADPANVNAGNPAALGATQPLAFSVNNGFNQYDSPPPTNTNEQYPSTINGEKITFQIPASSTGISFFREPTLINKPDPSGGAASDAGPPRGSQVLATGTTTPTHGTGYSAAGTSGVGYLTSYYRAGSYVNGTNGSSLNATTASSTDNQKYLGFALGPVPLWFPTSSTSTLSTMSSGVYFASGTNGNFTYQIQYQSPNASDSGTYITYDEKFLPTPNTTWNRPRNTFLMTSGGLGSVSSGDSGGGGSSNGNGMYDPVECDNYEVVLDPRTAQFSVCNNYYGDWNSGGYYYAMPFSYNAGHMYWNQWVDSSQNALATFRPDYNAGYNIINPTAALGFYNLGNTGDTGPTSTGVTGLLSQNAESYGSGTAYWGDSLLNQGPATSNPQYYSDADGVVRRASAGYFTWSTGTVTSSTAYNALPLATSTVYNSGVATPAVSSSRPIMLNRPFRSVADLGYVFSGTPWKNIDFSTPESGYSALLDVFCINDTDDPGGLVAGKVNLNTRQAPVLQALLSGAYKNEFNSGTSQLSATDASNLINQATYGLLSRTTSTTAGYGPLTNISDLVGKWRVDTGVTTAPVNGATASNYSGYSGDLSNITLSGTSSNFMTVPRFREAAIRALANCGQTRVWNLMIDVIAQTGHFPASATGLGNFIVEGEQRYWVHVAIDRSTGQVLDQQIEEVKE